MRPLHGRNYRVSQAVVVVSAEADCTVDDALLIMQEHARANDQTLEEVAIDIVSERIRLGTGREFVRRRPDLRIVEDDRNVRWLRHFPP